MAGDETVLLRDVCVKIGSGATPRGGKEAYKGGATSLIRSQNIYNEGFHRDGLVYIDDDQSAELRNVEVKPDDVLLNITGDSVARCCQVAAYVLPARVNQHVAIIRPQPKSLDARFLRYVLVSHEYQSRLLALASAGATRPALTKLMIEELDIPSPPLAEQKAIAAVLGALDDKIELNRRMNATLEAMARALFQSWFVDFDPVRRNLDFTRSRGERGEEEKKFQPASSPLRASASPRDPFPALDPATTALFPDTFQDSTAGHIPSGWRVMKVSEFIERLSVGQKYEQKTVSPVGKVPVLDQGKSGVIGFHNNEPGVTATLDKPVAVFANHTCYMRLITYSFSAIQNVLPFVGSVVDTFWAYYATEGRLSFSEYKGHWPDFVIQESVVPPRELTDAFGRLAKPLVAQVRNNEEESRTLATLRDTLLPRLLSGELSVAGIESKLEAVT